MMPFRGWMRLLPVECVFADQRVEAELELVLSAVE